MGKDACFQVLRFNIMSAALDPKVGERLSDAYVFAWYAGVYPSRHGAAGFHQPFAESFSVTKEMVEELAKYLDDSWRNNTVPTFYGLEDAYRSRGGFDRGELIDACRYFFLSELFDAKFWTRIMENHPAEASLLRKPFNRADDLYFN